MIIFTISDKCLISCWEIISVDEDTYLMKQGFNCWLMMVHTDQGDRSSNHSNKVCNVQSYIMLVWLIWPRTCGPNCNESFVAWLQGCLPKTNSSYLAPDRGIGHTTRLEPWPLPTHNTPYKMSVNENDEVKKHVVVFLVRGFLLPNISSCGAPVLFGHNN